jgi:uncharacterized protein YbbK (DUF523 family)
MENIKLGISSCLLGLKVRYDGGHRHDKLLMDALGASVQYVCVCPEVECGLGVPREAMRLEGDTPFPRLITISTKKDMTDKLRIWAYKRVEQLETENLGGFIFKSDSPSCGMKRVKVYNDDGMPVKVGAGIFARIFMEHFPLLPVEDEASLHDLQLRGTFMERIFALKREHIPAKKESPE